MTEPLSPQSTHYYLPDGRGLAQVRETQAYVRVPLFGGNFWLVYETYGTAQTTADMVPDARTEQAHGQRGGDSCTPHP